MSGLAQPIFVHFDEERGMNWYECPACHTQSGTIAGSSQEMLGLMGMGHRNCPLSSQINAAVDALFVQPVQRPCVPPVPPLLPETRRRPWWRRFKDGSR